MVDETEPIINERLGRCKTAGLGATDIGVDASTQVKVIGP